MRSMKAMLKPLALGASAWWLGGCMVGPDYRVPDSAPITLASAHAEQFTGMAAPQPWWQLLEDPALSARVEQALAGNLSVQQVQATLVAAEAVVDERRRDRYPAVTAGAEYQRGRSQQVSGGPRQRYGHQQAGLHMAWELDLFGRLARDRNAAAAHRDAVAAELDQARLSLAAEVARSYYQARGLRQQLRVLAQEQRSWQQALAWREQQAVLGAGSPEQQAQIAVELAAVEAQRPPLIAALQQAENRLAVLTGVPPGQAGPVAETAPAAPGALQLPLGDVDQLLRNRPDVRRAERQLASRTEQVGAATAELYPRLDLSGMIGVFALRGSDLGRSTRAHALTPTLSWPALDWGSVKARVRVAEAQADQAERAYQQQLLIAQEELEAALNGLAAAQQQLDATLRAAHHSGDVQRMVQARYQAGSALWLEVLDSERALHRLQRQAVAADTASWLQVVALYQALAWGLPPAG